MPKFTKNEIEELKKFLYNCCIHDAKLESVRYEREEDNLKIEAFNPIFNAKIDITFFDVEIALVIRGNEFGSRETIISLTAEEDYSYLKNCIQNCSEGVKDFLYLLFQTLSGDEFHIVSRMVIIELGK